MSTLRKGQIVAWVYESGEWKISNKQISHEFVEFGTKYFDYVYEITNGTETRSWIRRKDLITRKEELFMEFANLDKIINEDIY